MIQIVLAHAAVRTKDRGVPRGPRGPKIYTNCFQDVIQHKVRMRIATLQCKDVGKGAERLSGENGQIERN